MAEREFFFGGGGGGVQKQGFSHFVLHVKRRLRGPAVKQPFNLYWWVELNFGQELVFLEASVFKLFPEKLFSNYPESFLLQPTSGNSSDE